MKLLYKESTRSPFYGRIITYDANGKVGESLDLLELRVTYGTKEYSLEEVIRLGLEANLTLPSLQKQLAETNAGLKLQSEHLAALELKTISLEEKLQIASELIILLNAQIEALKLQ